MTTTTAARAQDYYDARLAFYTTGDYAHADRSHVIADRAYDAGQGFDEVAVDEDARIAANGGKPLTTA